MAAPLPAPDGYVWTGTVYARINPIAGDPSNIMTPSQLAGSTGQAAPPTLPEGWQQTTDGYLVRGDSSIKYTPEQAKELMKWSGNATPANTGVPDPSPFPENYNAGAMAQQQLMASGAMPTGTSSAGSNYMSQDAQAYFAANPDVWGAYQANNYGLNPTAFAQTHYNNHGSKEGRAWGVPAGTPAPTPAPVAAPAPVTAPPPGGGGSPLPTGGGTGSGAGGNINPGLIDRGSAAPPPAAGGSIGGALGGLGNTITPGQGGLTRTQSLQYIYNYPDLQTAWEASGMDPVTFANQHYSTHGQGEQRTYQPTNNFSNALGLGAQSNYYPVGQNRVSPQLQGNNAELAQQLHDRMQGQRQMSPTSAGLAALYGYGTTGAYSPQMPFYTPFTGYAEVDGPGKARYFDAYKDVRDAYYNDANVGRGTPKSNGYMDQYTPAQFAALHFNTHGEAEGRVSPYGNDGLFTTRFAPTVMQNFQTTAVKPLADKAEEIASDAAATARAAATTPAYNGAQGGDGG